MNNFDNIYLNLINKIDKKILEKIDFKLKNCIFEREIYKDKYFEVEINLKNKGLEPSEEIKIFEDNINPIILFKEKIDSIYTLKISFLKLDRFKKRELNIKLMKIEIEETRYENVIQIMIDLKNKKLNSLNCDSKNIGKYSINNNINFNLFEKLEYYLTYKELEYNGEDISLKDYFELKYDINIKTEPLYMAIEKIFEKVYNILDEK